MRFLLVAFILTLMACGKRGGDGAPGASGAPCFVSKSGDTATVVCPDGSTASITDGLAGSQGPQGTQGPKGDPGASGSVIEPIELCPAGKHSAAYYALCLDSKLYGVVEGQGDQMFLSVIAPGGYRCDNGSPYRVDVNCQVTQ